MKFARYVGHTVLFGKPYCWVLMPDGKLSLISDISKLAEINLRVATADRICAA